MSTGLLEQRAFYPRGEFVYRLGANGGVNKSTGKKEIDCSHLLHQMLLNAGYSVPYQNTSALLNSTYFDQVSAKSVSPGDIALWVNEKAVDGSHIAGHVGVVETSLDANLNGRFFGSQNSTGPASAQFGPKSFYWPAATKFLRPKAEFFKGKSSDVVRSEPSKGVENAKPIASISQCKQLKFGFPVHQPNGNPYENESAVFAALKSESSGNYLIGKGNFFHGGIHITDKVAPHCKDKDMVRCIADGTVVAYRLNKNYLSVSHLGENLSYSSSFCLIRHDYASAVGASGTCNTLTFYSLYMHLAAHSVYSTAAASQTYKITESRLRARNKPELGDDFIGYISVGAQIDVSDVREVTGGGATYVFAKGTIKSGQVKNDAGKVPAKKGSVIWVAIEKKGEKPARYAVPDTSVAPSLPCYWKDAPALDCVVACQVPIKAGDPVGRLGLCDMVAGGAGGVVSKHQVHLEVFTFDPGLDAFLKNKAGVKLGATHHHLKQGTKLWSKTESKSGAVFSQTDNELPRDFVYSPGVPKSKDKDGKEWMEIEFKTQSQQFHGYVPVDSAELVGQHDWEKMGFKKIEAPANFDGYLPPVMPPPFFQNLCKLVTGDTPPVDRDSIREALTGDKHRHAWSKIVVKQVSDWKHQSTHSVWAVLDRVMKKSPDMVAHERQRIDSCLWWDEVAAKVPGFDKSGVVWHFHPIGFLKLLVDAKFSWAKTPFADLLASVESRGDYSAYNRTKGGLKAFFKTNLTAMRISEIKEKQSKEKREMFAVGRYQIIPLTLNEAIKFLKIDEEELFSPEIQDRIFDEYLIRVKRPEIIAYLEGSGDIEDAIYGWAKEFASAGVRAGRKISQNRIAKGGESYYSGDGLNKAHLTPEQMVLALEQSKNMKRQ